ncbi:serine/threonine-protein kinase [Maliponia aquimaris]|uniref:Serine/threonine-protein kinase pkn6 n=1 Tax=Maliponia aquimaris TaxID=1673631 RepID=A0A238L4Y8_9RHOB|nr:serine/threonine-protein kinase [Maliponia aquimaris]SMX50145.1 Serine/threonine-protein kinase pkn6 [Maliponia aquimaris]
MTHQSTMPPAESARVTGDGLPPGTTLCNGQYVIDKYLNSGGFGITYLARDSLGRKVVIKECFPNAICCRSGETVRLRSQAFDVDFTRAVDLFQKEARALAKLQHPNIVGVHQIFQANGTAYMALDFVEGTDLFDLLDQSPGALDPAAIRELAVLLLQALSYVHRNGILHRDISPDNILLDTLGTPVLIDFGAARQSASQASRVLSRVHTVKDGYSPQEFYIAGSAQSRSSDLYALAATFVHLIEGRPPPHSSLRLASVAEQKPDPFRPLSGRYPEHDARLLRAIDTCLNLFAKDRLQSADDWLAALSGRLPSVTFQPQGAPVDSEIEMKIAEMVASNHEAIAADAARPDARRSPARVVDPEAEKRAKEREYWAILNEDPAQWRDAAKTEAAEAAEAAPDLDDDPEPAPRRTRRFSLSALLPWSGRGARRSMQSNA